MVAALVLSAPPAWLTMSERARLTPASRMAINASRYQSAPRVAKFWPARWPIPVSDADLAEPGASPPN